VKKQYYIYIMTNQGNSTLYTGVTNNLKRRSYEHKEKLAEGFTKKYNLTKLVYYEFCDDVKSAINREKQLKGGSRKSKLTLVSHFNPDWHDLYEEL